MKMKNLRVKIQEKLELNSFGPQYLEHNERVYKIKIWNNDSFLITDVTNAGKRGTVCNELSVNSNYGAPDLAFWNELLATHTTELLKATTDKILPPELEKPNFKFYFREVESKRLLALDLSTIKPLKTEPKKWTLPHVVRAIVNGQYEGLRCKYRHLDDTCEDFGKGEIKDPINFVKGIVEDPSGWWTHQQTDGVVTVCCHSFDSNEFKPKIEPTKKVKPVKTPEVSRRKFDIGCGHLGNGLLVWNRNKEVSGDFEKVAHINADREITYYIENLPSEVLTQVESYAKTNPSVSTSQPEIKVFNEGNPTEKNVYEAKKEARIERLRERAKQKHEFADNNGFDLFSEEKSGIPFGQPLVGSPQRMRQQRKYREKIANKIERAMEARNYAHDLEVRADAAESRRAIDSDDPEAIRKINEKIQSIKDGNEWAIAANAKMRKLKTWQDAHDYFIKLDDDDSKRIVTHLIQRKSFYAIPPTQIRAYYFGTDTAEIRRLEKRLKGLRYMGENSINFSVGEITVKEESGQIQVHFPDKPVKEFRLKLRRGFCLKWSRYSAAWVRKRTPSINNRYINELKNVLLNVEYER